MYNKNLKIGIAALGLIGGSIYKNLHKNGFLNIAVYSHNTETVETVINNGHQASENINILQDCEIVFVCSPISQTTTMIKDIFKINRHAVFVDVASLKYDILKEIEQLDNCKFIGSHPMAGTENSGFKYSFVELFEGAKWVVIPSKNVSENEISMVKEIISQTGANIVDMDAKTHDLTVAKISHMPMLLAQGLVLANIDDDNSKLLASSGFRDMTRLAMSNKIMAKDMLKLNKENVKIALKEVIEKANNLLNSDFFDENIDKIIQNRIILYDKNGKNIFRNNG